MGHTHAFAQCIGWIFILAASLVLLFLAALRLYRWVYNRVLSVRAEKEKFAERWTAAKNGVVTEDERSEWIQAVARAEKRADICASYEQLSLLKTMDLCRLVNQFTQREDVRDLPGAAELARRTQAELGALAIRRLYEEEEPIREEVHHA